MLTVTWGAEAVKSIVLAATAVGSIFCAAGAGYAKFGCVCMSLLCAHWLYARFMGVCMLWLMGFKTLISVSDSSQYSKNRI